MIDIKLKVACDKKSQTERQMSVWNILTSTLPPAPLKTLVRMIISCGIIGIGIAVSIIIGAVNLETNMIVFAVILIIVGVTMLSGTLFDFFAKKRKKRKLMKGATDSIEKMFGELPDVTAAEFIFSAAEFTVTFLADAKPIKKLTCKPSECDATASAELLAIDFTDDASFCFTTEEIDKDSMFVIKKLLLQKRAAYRTIEQDARGKYYVVESKK